MPTKLSVPTLHVRAASLQGTRWENTPLLELIPDNVSPFVWFGWRQSMVGWGTAAEWSSNTPSAISDSASWWDQVRRSAISEADHTGLSLPLAFGSYGFVSPSVSYLSVPEFVIATTNKERWAVSMSCSDTARDPLEVLAQLRPSFKDSELTGPGGLVTDTGRMTQAEWATSVEELARRLQAGDAAKAVMARDMLVRAETAIDQRYLLARLNRLYPQTWRFAVHDLVGATPEMLASVHVSQLRSRVLAGTAPAGHADELLASAKDRREHTLAVDSVVSALAPLASEVNAPDDPFILELPNVVHFASDIHATLADSNLLDAVAALHPTAAVCGTPRLEALELLKVHEQTARGRYSGPVGWIDADGEGEFCIALRCGLVEDDGHTLRIFAGGGIMPDSDPEIELAETRQKMAPLLDALSL